MVLDAAEIKKTLDTKVAKNGKHYFNIHSEKFKPFRDLVDTEYDELEDFIAGNGLDARTAVYTKQGLCIGLELKEAYEYCLDRDMPLHPLFAQKQNGGQPVPVVKGKARTSKQKLAYDNALSKNWPKSYKTAKNTIRAKK